MQYVEANMVTSVKVKVQYGVHIVTVLIGRGGTRVAHGRRVV